jgi:DNA-binding Lrp family transcriptional regulator
LLDVDRIDRLLLRLLSKDGRQSNKQLAAAAGIAESTCHERVKRLRSAGIIRGTHARVAPAALGVGLEALFFLRFGNHSRAFVDAILARTMEVDEVRAAYLVTGKHDLIVHVAVRDIGSLKEFALDHFTSRPEVVSIETSVIFDYAIDPQLPDLADAAAA